MAKINCNPCLKMSALEQFFVLNIAVVLLRSGRFSNSLKTFTFRKKVDIVSYPVTVTHQFFQAK